MAKKLVKGDIVRVIQSMGGLSETRYEVDSVNGFQAMVREIRGNDGYRYSPHMTDISLLQKSK